jgi:hydroxymethylglutaryl-CoA reductase (NADPH)
MTGSIGCNFQTSNGLAALYIACGQDPACVAESHASYTTFQEVETGLIASINMPNVVAGTVGGGTKLPMFHECLKDILNVTTSTEFAEVVVGTCLAGELSICAAFCSNDFASAHMRLSGKSR